tara:strand:+ start:2718 stop:2990 length:273 start_codon:yes stop_codon:yes gene_type:complete
MIDDLEAMEEESRLNDPVRAFLGRVYFVSKSKGRGRRRRHWEEVELVHNKVTGRYRLAHLFPFDLYASEVLPEASRDEAETQLRARFSQL